MNKLDELDERVKDYQDVRMAGRWDSEVGAFLKTLCRTDTYGANIVSIKPRCMSHPESDTGSRSGWPVLPKRRLSNWSQNNLKNAKKVHFE